MGILKSRLTIFADILLIGTECKSSGEFDIHFVRQNPWDCRTDITLLDKLIKSTTFDNDFEKISFDCIFDVKFIISTSVS